MEHGLGDYMWNMWCEDEAKVLILVLMEHGLGVLS